MLLCRIKSHGSLAPLLCFRGFCAGSTTDSETVSGTNCNSTRIFVDLRKRAASPMLYQSAMQRLTARLLLFLTLLGVLAPAALAASAPPQTNCCSSKCCRRKGPHTHPSSGPSFQAASCCRHDCGCWLTVSQCADVAPALVSHVSRPAVILSALASSILRTKPRRAAHAVRGPPAFSAA